MLFFLFAVMFLSCDEYTPKPEGYRRIVRQQAVPVRLDNPKFSFLYSGDTGIEYLKSESGSGIWFNILYPDYNAILYCTYMQLSSEQDLSKMSDDSYKLAYSHASVAQGISQTRFVDSLNHTFGIIYDIQGSVASPLQFYATDNASGFLRGSLYFSNAANADSVAPVVTFVKDDIIRIMETLVWMK
jgi:gliding motility-associated lipoprotein GldD